MNDIRKVVLHYIGLPLLAASLAACASGGPTTPSKVALQGAIGVAEQQTTLPMGLSPLAMPSKAGVEGLNRAILAATGRDGLLSQSADAPIRGLNATVLNNYLGAQSGESVLFGLSSQSVLAVDSSGEVLADGEIQSDGTWSVVVETEQWSEAGTVGLVQGYEYDNGTPSDASDDFWVCTEPLEYETSAGNTVPALFGASAATSGMSVLGTKSVGLFNYHQETANPASMQSNSDITPVSDSSFDSGDYLACGSADHVAYAAVTADFDWAMPTGVDEAFMYDYGVAFGLDVSDVNYPEFVSVAALDNLDGTMAMEVVKPAGSVQTLSLVMTDVAFYDETKFGMPLTPTFALDAAINPQKPYIEVGDAGHDYQVLSGGMAYIEGTAYARDGITPAPGSLILAVLDSAEILDFNLAVADESGQYQLLLPATDPSLGYHIVGLSADGSYGGFPTGIPWYDSSSAYDYRYALHSVSSYTSADVTLEVALDSH